MQKPMNAQETLASLKQFTPPPDWKTNSIFLLPDAVMCDLYQFILDNRLSQCIELGTGFGATCCMIAAAIEQLDDGKIITIDKYLHQPVNVKVLAQHVGLSPDHITVIADQLGYNWYLADLIQQHTKNAECTPLFDFCLLDGAHEWEPDALAFFLVAKLIKPGGWIVIDDINYFFRIMPDWEQHHAHRTPRELDTLQMKMVYDIAVQQHPDFCDFHITHDGRIGWARKKPLPHTKKKWFFFRR